MISLDHPKLAGVIAKLRHAMPAAFFFGGFLWDALTIGRSVTPIDLWTLAAYLLGAGALLWYQGHRPGAEADPESAAALRWWRTSGPYFLLQFLFGSMFSALFIFYFKSSSNLLATLWTLGLGGLLVANEFLEDHYRRYTLTWALFGLCAMLLLNFVVPHLIGSIAAIWFVLSTLAGAGLTHGLRRWTPGRPGRIGPVWAIAACLLAAYLLDIIPPVPLVKRDMVVGHNLVHVDGHYGLSQEKAPWWVFWRTVRSQIHVRSGERLYCVSAVFAPSGLTTRLYHRWSHFEPYHGWVDASRIGFELAGGRSGGYRGYTWKQNLAPGEWRVTVETEDGRTVAVHHFELATEPLAADAPMLEKLI